MNLKASVILKSIYFFLCLCIPFYLFATIEDVRFENLSVEEGLSQRYVFGVATDSLGFLWISTEGGLNKYDGYEFRHFKHDPNNPRSIAGNVLRQVELSHAGGKHKLWVGTIGNGLSCLDLETELFDNYQHDPLDSTSLSNKSAWVLEESIIDGVPYLWVGMGVRGELDRFDYRTKEFKHYKIPGLPTALYQDNQGIMWVGASGLLRYNPGTDDFTRVTPDPDKNDQYEWHGIHRILDDKNGTLWFGSRKGMNKVISTDRSADQFEIYSYTHNPDDPNSYPGRGLSYLFEDNQGELWTARSALGLSHFDHKTERFTRFMHDPDDPHSISSDIMYSMCEDSSGNMWIGTIDGIDKWDRQKAVFSRYDHMAEAPTGLERIWITGITSTYEQEQEILWVTAYGKGLCRLNRETGSVRWFSHDPENPNSLPANTVHNVLSTEKNKLLISTMSGYSLYDIDRDEFQTLYIGDDPYSSSFSLTYSTSIGPTGRIWFGTLDYVAEFLPSETMRVLVDSYRGWQSIFETNNRYGSNLWAGTFHDGLMCLDLESNEKIWYQHDKNDPTSIASNLVEALYSSSLEGKEVLWVGTDAGLDRFDIEHETFTHYTTAHGLPHNSIRSIVEDSDGILWITCQMGLTRFDPIEESFRSFWAADGLPGDGYEFETMYINVAGEIFVGGYNGLVSFFPADIKENSRPPNVVLTDFKLFHQSVPVDPDSTPEDSEFSLRKHISRLKELRLEFRQNILSFTFSALDLRSPKKNRYAYMMEGFDEDWIYTNAEHREANYMNLPPGRYVFRVKGSNNDGVWNETGTALVIIIKPPWWRSYEANVLYLLLIGTLGTFLYRLRISRLRIQHQAELDHIEAEKYLELDELKSRFFANISHEFRTPLTLILGPVKKMLSTNGNGDDGKELRLIQRQAKRLLSLVTQLLDLTRIEESHVRLQASQRNIIPLLKALVLSFSSLAERRDISLTFHTDLEDIQVYVEKESVVKIMNNLLSNAFKFTHTGDQIQVLVGVNEESVIGTDGVIQIDVVDTGFGVPVEDQDRIFDRFYQSKITQESAKASTGIGLALTKELVDLHKGKIFLESCEGIGSTFTVLLPLGSQHLKTEEIIAPSGEDESLDFALDEIEPVASEPEPLSKGSILPRILIVEDNSDVRAFIRSYLDKEYRCFEADNGLQGLQMSGEQRFELIISDIMMPRMNGVEFCRKIKSDQNTSHIPVILLTAKADLESKIEGLETGADDYLTKPFEAEELVLRVNNLIQQRQKLRERFQKDIALIPEELDLSSIDQQFVQNAIRIVSENLDNPNFSVNKFSKKIRMSRQHLNRKLKSVTGLSTLEFIRLQRLKRAALLLKNNEATITEIAFQVGFSNPSHFTRSFQKEFGVTPSKYLTEH